ncbi:MAG: tetratricopeptide repeat protein [Candidatus Geothermincolia bacterium]
MSRDLPTHHEPQRVRAVLFAALLLGALVFIYRGVAGFDFVNLDDPDYVSGNRMVQGGLNWSGVWWAFTAFHAANWHPLTWLSHMADASLFGMNAGAHHLSSLALHAAGALLLFQLLRALTGSFWRSAAVAALFAVHPAQVEAVAWVAERKTVLAALLGLLTVRTYLWHLARPATRSFAPVVVLFTLGLLAKPMLVVLPLILLLLDWWPLGRLGRGGMLAGTARPLILEKASLFALALLSVIVTIAAQTLAGAVASLEFFPLPVRLGNALLSCVAYLGELFVPHDLSVFYRHPSGSLPWVRAGLAALVLAGVSFLAWRSRRRAPFLAVGWLWFLVTLLPVIGIVQVGSQARADRYLYLPLVGIFLAVGWGAADLARRRPRSRVPVALSIAAAVALLALAAHRQAGYWRDSGTLWEHALAVDPASETALYQLSEHDKDLGRFNEQAVLLRRLVKLNPRHERALNNLCIARYRLGEKPEALFAEYQALLAVNPRSAKALQNYGYLLIESGRYAEAIVKLEQAVEFDPGYCLAVNNLGRAYLAAGDKTRARRIFERAVTCDPQNQTFRANLNLAR